MGGVNSRCCGSILIYAHNGYDSQVVNVVKITIDDVRLGDAGEIHHMGDGSGPVRKIACVAFLPHDLQ